jgi:predicted RNA-binding protein with PIN domain
MISNYLLVDGHNVIHSWSHLLKWQLKGEQRYIARKKLEEELQLLQDITGQQVVLIFDGTQADTTDERREGALQLIYASKQLGADMVIEKLVLKYAEQYRIRVCSADSFIRNAILSQKAEWLSPETLMRECQLAQKQLQERLKNQK